MPRPILATIDLAAMRHNLAVARRHAASRFLWAVVKANAYGHGIERAVRAFADADGLALLDLDEAERARAAGWRRPILLLEGFFEPADLRHIERLQLTAVVHDVEQLAMLERHRAAQPIAIYLKLNTGMNRLGLADATSVAAALARLRALRDVRIEALMTHFANADRTDAGPARVVEQLNRFTQLAPGWDGASSACNSAALLLHQVDDQAVRAGIMLYGAAPDPMYPVAQFGLRAAMQLRSQLIAVRDVEPGESVGYGAQFTADRRLRVGVVACGYADGYPRRAPNGTPVGVAGVRTGTLGRVSMDLISVDLSAVPHASVGTPVELWGTNVPIDEVAAPAGTVGYELMCALAARVPVVESE